MNTSPLNTHIDALSKALKDAKQFDAKTREALTSLQKEIDQLLNPEADTSLAHRLEHAAIRGAEVVHHHGQVARFRQRHAGV